MRYALLNLVPLFLLHNFQAFKKNEYNLILTQMTNFRFFQSERQFQINENGKKFSRPIENTVGKGEIACYKQFLIFPQCFHSADT